MSRWSHVMLPAGSLVLLFGCAALEELPAAPGPQTYSEEAYETAPPRKAAYVAECTRRGGRIVDRFCYTEGAGGPVLIDIPESFDTD